MHIRFFRNQLHYSDTNSYLRYKSVTMLLHSPATSFSISFRMPLPVNFNIMQFQPVPLPLRASEKQIIDTSFL